MLLKAIRPGRATATRRPSIVLLHAFPCDAHLWDQVIPALEDRIDVIALHLPGVSGQPLDPQNPPDIVGVAEQVRRALTDMGVGEAVLVGNSMGGYVALEAWRQWPHRIAGLALVGTRADADDSAATQRRQEVMDRVAQEGTGFLLDTLPRTLLSSRTQEKNPAAVEALRAMIRRIPAHTIIATHKMLAGRPDSTATLKTIRVPTIVIVGEEDTVAPPTVAEAMAKSIPACRLATVPGAGHLLPLEAPDTLVKILNRFLDNMGAAQMQRLGIPSSS